VALLSVAGDIKQVAVKQKADHADAPDDHDEKTRFPADHKDTSSHVARSRAAARLLRRHLTMQPATPPSAIAPQ
jgi:hypothetical protein